MIYDMFRETSATYYVCVCAGAPASPVTMQVLASLLVTGGAAGALSKREVTCQAMRQPPQRGQKIADTMDDEIRGIEELSTP